jgi:hypothetical protein
MLKKRSTRIIHVSTGFANPLWVPADTSHTTSGATTTPKKKFKVYTFSAGLPRARETLGRQEYLELLGGVGSVREEFAPKRLSKQCIESL